MPTTADNLTPAGVDRVVRDVLAEMNGRLVGGNRTVAESGDALLDKPAVAPGVLSVDDRVVTMATLDGRLAGVSHVVMAGSAVVTPAARDELRDRGITLERGRNDSAAAKITSRRLVFAVTDGRCDTDTLARVLGSTGVTMETVECDGLADTVDRLAERVTHEAVVAAVATSRPAAAVCLANRHAGVRAATASSTDDVQRAVEEIGANVLVLGLVGMSTYEMQTAVRRFAELTPRGCPSEFASRLG